LDDVTGFEITYLLEVVPTIKRFLFNMTSPVEVCIMLVVIKSYNTLYVIFLQVLGLGLMTVEIKSGDILVILAKVVIVLIGR
jgi:hypothetical protein